MQKDAVWTVERDSYIPAINGPDTHECEQEIWEPHYVLRR